jgi:hypothetical protein
MPLARLARKRNTITGVTEYEVDPQSGCLCCFQPERPASGSGRYAPTTCPCCTARTAMPGVFSQYQAAYTETRPSPSVRRRITAQAAERDGWLCHRYGLLIDRHERWPHPLALVGDHYPMPCCCGGPYNLANIRAAHSLCNGSTSGIRPQAIPFTVTAAQSEVINQILGAQDR